jgi:DNA helicase-2/ATP-dependent DNA helicase PcrA
VNLRFIEEIDAQYLEYLTPAESSYRYKSMIDKDIFGDVDKSKLVSKTCKRNTTAQYNMPKPDLNVVTNLQVTAWEQLIYLKLAQEM